MPPKTAPAIDKLIEEHSDRAYTAAYRLTGNPADASDLVQEAFLRVLKKADLYNPAFDFGGWLNRILYRVYLNRRRSRNRLQEIPLEPDYDGQSTGAGDWKADFSESPEITLERNEVQTEVLGALNKLPNDFRACLVLVDIEGRDYEEAAEILSWPVGSVAGRLFRARRLMRQWLKPREGE